jgi:hypothetical protein
MHSVVPAQLIFRDDAHLERFIRRKISMTAGADVLHDSNEPIIEIGTVLAGRPARLIATGAFTGVGPLPYADVRLHAATPPALADLVGLAMLDQTAADLLRETITTRRGMMIVGDVGTGKTTLLQALSGLLPSDSVVVERASELRPPPGHTSLVALPPTSFADQIAAAPEDADWLMLDEVRFDESRALWVALTERNSLCLWAFRGATDASRLRIAFSMAIRRAHPQIAQQAVHRALLERLPIVVFMTRREGGIGVTRVGEWRQAADSTEALDLHILWDGDSQIKNAT